MSGFLFLHTWFACLYVVEGDVQKKTCSCMESKCRVKTNYQQVCVCINKYVLVYVCMCVCEREREREKEGESEWVRDSFLSIVDNYYYYCQLFEKCQSFQFLVQVQTFNYRHYFFFWSMSISIANLLPNSLDQNLNLLCHTYSIIQQRRGQANFLT